MGKLQERNHSEDLGVDEGMILKWLFKKQDGRVWTVTIQLRAVLKADSYERGCAHLGSIKCGEFLDQLRKSCILIKASASRSQLISYSVHQYTLLTIELLILRVETAIMSAVRNLTRQTSFVSMSVTFLKPTGHVMHQQSNIQQLYALPTLYLCVLYLSENKQRLVPLTA